LPDENIALYLNLLENLNFKSYRDNQIYVIHAFVKREDQIVVMKTGGGKTLPISK
jgi:superfamily II DNA helicase RecQ